MAPSLTIYGLCSADDDTIVYVGATGVSLKSCRVRHLRAARFSDSPVQRWIRGTGAGLVRIVPLIEGAGPDDERAEIERRVALGERLLNVRDGGQHEHTHRPALNCRADAEHHASISNGDCATSAVREAFGDFDGRIEPSWLVLARAVRPIRPREPLHINAWRARREAAAPPEQLRRAS